jgi:HK97 family phage portal protein
VNWTPNWSALFARKANAVARAMVLLVTPGAAHWPTRNYAHFANEGYEANVTVYACVNQIARSVKGLRWVLTKRVKGRLTEVETHPLLDLLQRPNPQESLSALLEKLVAYQLVAGNAYLHAVAAPSQPLRPRELYVLRPDRMTLVPNAVGEIARYEYQAGGMTVLLATEAVMHRKFFAPTDDWYGLSPIQVAARVVDTDNLALTWNYSLLKNGARPSGAMVVQKNLTDAQYTRLQQAITEQYGGAQQAGYPMLLEGGADWKEMSLSPKDMDWLESRRFSKEEICIVYNVPGELVGLKTATFENRREARRSFYTENVLPMADGLKDDLNRWLVPSFGDGLTLDYDRDAIEALAEDREKVWSRVEKSTWLTVNEKRAATGYDDHPDGNVVLVPVNLLPLGTETGASYADLTAADAAPKGLPAPELRKGDLTDTLPENPARERLWKGVIRRDVLPVELRYQAAVKHYFMRQRDAVLAKLAARPEAIRGTQGADEHKAVEEILFDLDAETGLLREVSRPLFEEALARGGKAAWLEIGADGAFGHDSTGAQTRIRGQLERVKAIVANARKRVVTAIEAGLNAPGGAESVASIASRIRDTYSTLSGLQATMIARTETARAYNEGRMEAFEQQGVEEIEWLSARDEGVRQGLFNHRIDGQIRRRGTQFSNGLEYPNDPLGEPGNTINCRCVVLPVIRRAAPAQGGQE